MTDEEIRQYLRKKKQKDLAKKRFIAFGILSILAVAAAIFIGGYTGNNRYESEVSQIISVTEDDPMVNVAVPEIGNEGGDKFWSWYGFDYRVDWCAIFASWCAYQCGYLDEDKAPSFAMVGDGYNWFKDRGQALDPDATPTAGDLIFFDWEQDGMRDHVGIVTAVKGDLVFTIEGNSSDRCRQKRYRIGDPVIYAYGHIE